MLKYKSKDVTRLVGIPSATLRDWRSQGKDFEGVWGKEKTKDHTYSRRGILSLAMMKEIRNSGGSLNEAWMAALVGVGELAKHLEIWNMEDWGVGTANKVISTTKASFILLSDEFPVVTDEPRQLINYSDKLGESVRSEFVYLRKIALNLAPELVVEIGGKPLERMVVQL